jgi:hypothetical protein
MRSELPITIRQLDLRACPSGWRDREREWVWQMLQLSQLEIEVRMPGSLARGMNTALHRESRLEIESLSAVLHLQTSQFVPMTYVARTSSHTSVSRCPLERLIHSSILFFFVRQQLPHQSPARLCRLVDNEVSRSGVPAIQAALGGLPMGPLPLHPVQVSPRISIANVHGAERFATAGRLMARREVWANVPVQ